jgi:hypothetical protein
MGNVPSVCASARTKDEENKIIVNAVSSGSSVLRLYDPVSAVESTVDNFSVLNQTICLIICPLEQDRKVGIQLLDKLTDKEVELHMPFWIAALRYNNTDRFSLDGIATDKDAWLGVAKHELTTDDAVVVVEDDSNNDSIDECALLGKYLVKRALASLPVYRKLYFALKAEMEIGEPVINITKEDSDTTTTTTATTTGDDNIDAGNVNDKAIDEQGTDANANGSSSKYMSTRDGINDDDERKAEMNIKNTYDELIKESSKNDDVNNNKLRVVQSQENLLYSIRKKWAAAGGSEKVGAGKLLITLQSDKEFWNDLNKSWLPTSYNKQIASVEIDEVCVYPTSCLPVKIFFQVNIENDSTGAPVVVSVPTGQEEVKLSNPPNEMKVEGENSDEQNEGTIREGIIFKCGDDLRQDQIVMSFCSLIQNILNNSGTKVRILTYDIVAQSRTEGCIEVIPNAKSINEIKYEFPIQYAPGFLAKALEENREKVMNNLVESCAGACLYSYVLALGDRHLDNLMMTDQGDIFHVDFGYIFGKDPHQNKYTPPKIRLDGCVVHALGGVGSPYYDRFEKLCLKGFVDLRRASTILIRGLYYFKYSRLPSLVNASKFKTRLKRLKSQLMWEQELSESGAVLKFKDILEESRNHFLQPLVEVLHNCSTSFNR